MAVDCPVVNRCHSRVPDLAAVTVPLTESEARHQRAMALAATKTNSNSTTDENHTVGTAVNPRERPRGMAAPPSGFINLNPTNQRVLPIVVPPPSSTTSTVQQRSGSAAQSLFDDDFSQYPTHALSLNNLQSSNTSSTPKSTANADRNVSRARPSPPSSISGASGLAIHKQLFPPPPNGSSNSISSTMHQHRRSASQTISPEDNFPNQTTTLASTETDNNGNDQRRHSVDSSMKTNADEPVVFIGDASSDEDDDPNGLGTNLTKLKIHNHSTENVKSRESLILNEDDRLFTKTYMAHTQLKSDDEQSLSSSSDEDEKKVKSKKKTQSNLTPLRLSHHGPLEEQEKANASPNINNKNLVKRLIERCSLQQNDETGNTSSPSKRKDSLTLALEHPISLNDRTKTDTDSDYDNDDDGFQTNPHNEYEKVGFDQLINEDSDDESTNRSTIPNRNMATSNIFLPTRSKEQQYEHFQDSDDDSDDLKSLPTKTTSSKFFFELRMKTEEKSENSMSSHSEGIYRFSKNNMST